MHAVYNDIALDVWMYELVGLDIATYGRLPRIIKFSKKLKNFPLFARFLYNLCLPIWYLIAPCFFRWQAWRAFPKIISCRDEIKFHKDGQVIVFSNRSIEIVNPHHIKPVPKQWIEIPWVPINKSLDEKEFIPIEIFIDKLDLKKSLKLAKIAHRCIYSRRRTSEWGLQTYTAWRWFIVRLAVDKMPGPFLMVEHFDRWAMLMDRSVRSNHSAQISRTLTVLQHGSVNANENPPGLRFTLPKKLGSVNHLRSYSPEDAGVFMRDIYFSRINYSDIKFSYYNSKIIISDDNYPEAGFSILFVGNPLCEDAHLAFLEYLLSYKKIKIYYKPHPVKSASREVKKGMWEFIDNRDYFPRVDLIISYPSTLVGEYAEYGIPAFVHPIDVSKERLLESASEVLSKIKIY